MDAVSIFANGIECTLLSRCRRLHLVGYYVAYIWHIIEYLHFPVYKNLTEEWSLFSTILFLDKVPGEDIYLFFIL